MRSAVEIADARAEKFGHQLYAGRARAIIQCRQDPAKWRLLRRRIPDPPDVKVEGNNHFSRSW